MLLNIPDIQTNRIMLNVIFYEDNLPNTVENSLKNRINQFIFSPGWSQDPEAPRSEWDNQSGLLVRLTLYVPPSYIYLFTDKQIPFTNYFDWCIERTEVDKYGDPTEWRRHYNGGFMNHSKNPEQPDWSSHS